MDPFEGDGFWAGEDDLLYSMLWLSPPSLSTGAGVVRSGGRAAAVRSSAWVVDVP